MSFTPARQRLRFARGNERQFVVFSPLIVRSVFSRCVSDLPPQNPRQGFFAGHRVAFPAAAAKSRQSHGLPVCGYKPHRVAQMANRDPIGELGGVNLMSQLGTIWSTIVDPMGCGFVWFGQVSAEPASVV